MWCGGLGDVQSGPGWTRVALCIGVAVLLLLASGVYTAAR
jgi:hypothetical protein